MTIIRDASKADDPVGLFRILSGRHRGRPSLKYEPTSSTQTYHQCLPRSLKMNHHLKFRRVLMDVFTLRPCACAGKQQVVLDFFEIGWSVIVRSDRSASSQSKQNYLARERGGFLQWVSIGSSSFAGGKLLGRVDLRVDRGH